MAAVAVVPVAVPRFARGTVARRTLAVVLFLGGLLALGLLCGSPAHAAHQPSSAPVGPERPAAAGITPGTVGPVTGVVRGATETTEPVAPSAGAPAAVPATGADALPGAGAAPGAGAGLGALPDATAVPGAGLVPDVGAVPVTGAVPGALPGAGTAPGALPDAGAAPGAVPGHVVGGVQGATGALPGQAEWPAAPVAPAVPVTPAPQAPSVPLAPGALQVEPQSRPQSEWAFPAQCGERSTPPGAPGSEAAAPRTPAGVAPYLTRAYGHAFTDRADRADRGHRSAGAVFAAPLPFAPGPCHGAVRQSAAGDSGTPRTGGDQHALASTVDAHPGPVRGAALPATAASVQDRPHNILEFPG
ncbi:hypothetical protein AB0J57_25030 [Streptomyces sp. NPDC049837]|uniref:hypothetical protein n=1 Tax=Streptomyces sp. NPDC049837 TaxID=3155277 RepID=UPI00343145CF